jgi:hypothetical protein
MGEGPPRHDREKDKGPLENAVREIALEVQKLSDNS